ncbi:eCIS core domain-containing protein [Catenulispora pinisilvae]|uniref:eCIS core domain-containing protein n=1 Tax=Catenulispora pinisilvae TaxID=2705253 RepID=UPI001E635C8F|nr:DUF4157 domain-containing protein [Catenulispora pinisilvae]
MRDQDTAKAGKASSTRSAPARSAAAPSTDPTGLLSLQRSVGNAAVVQLLAEAGDAHSQESHEHGPGCGHGGGDAPVQRSSVQSVLSAPGSPLAAPMRAEMESRLGADFSDVRLHTGGAAQRSAAEIGARAYTSGNHVVIGDGGGDKHTLAHELTHVIQQRQGPVAGADNGSGLKVSDPSDRFERAAEANATRVLSRPVAAESANAQAGAGAEGPVQRAAIPSSPGSPAAADQIQRAGATGLLERGKAAVKHGADVAGAAVPATADYVAGGLATGGTVPAAPGKEIGIGAAGVAGGVAAIPDLAMSVITVCTAAGAWIHVRNGSEEEKRDARRQFEKAMAATASNASAAGGGIAGGVGTITGAMAPAAAGGAAGIFTGLYGAIKGAVDAVHSGKQERDLKKVKLPAKDNLLEEFLKLEVRLEENHKALLSAHQQLGSQNTSSAVDKARHDKVLETHNAQYHVAKASLDANIEECRELAGLHAARDLGEQKSKRKKIRSILASAAGFLGVPVGVLAIVAAVLGLTAGAVPIAGVAIAAAVAAITTGVLSWKFFNKYRASLKRLKEADDHSEKNWKIYFEALKVWQPKSDSSRIQAANALYEALTAAKYPANQAVAEELVKALRLKPEELRKMPADKALAKIKDRLASS